MDSSKLKIAIEEAERFLVRAQDLQEADIGGLAHSKERAAVRRASMDLTRALSDLRRRSE